MNKEEKQAREEAYKDVKMYLANDWDLKEETPQAFILKRNEASGLGHLVVFCIIGWWTFGIANLLYHIFKNKTKKILK